MRLKYFYIILIFCFLSGGKLNAQDKEYSPYAENGDSLTLIILQDVLVLHSSENKNEKQIAAYNKLVRDVKKTLPYAKIIYATLIETYEYMETLPKAKREAHVKRMESDLFEKYKPELMKMTLTQGKLLIRLVDRECNQTSYELAKAFLGPFRAGFWNLFAGMFGASLKTNWEPNGKDAEAERVVRLVEAGIL